MLPYSRFRCEVRQGCSGIEAGGGGEVGVGEWGEVMFLVNV